MATKMATVDKAQELLEKLRSASWNAAVQGDLLTASHDNCCILSSLIMRLFAQVNRNMVVSHLLSSASEP